MRVLVTGAKGMLGQDLLDELAKRGHEPIPTDVDELDITDPMSVARIPDGDFGSIEWIFNCAAYTAVDKAEENERTAYEINAIAAGYLANAAAMSAAKILHVSTDFVFDGFKSEPFTEQDSPRPLGAYGRTKLAGEEAVMESNPNSLIVRTAWLYGPRGNSFPRTMIRAFEAGRSLRVVADQIGNPTYTADLVRTMVDMAEMNVFPGIYHATGPDTLNWWEFAKLAIQTWTGKEPIIEPIASSEWPAPAPRPKNSALSNAKLAATGVAPMRPVAEALAEFCERLRSLGGA